MKKIKLRRKRKRKKRKKKKLKITQKIIMRITIMKQIKKKNK
jgi:hypothetical protein